MNLIKPFSLIYRYFVQLFVSVTLLLAGCTCEKEADISTTQRKARESTPWLTTAFIARIELALPSDGKTFERVEKRIADLQRAGFTAVWLSTITPMSSIYPDHQHTDPVPAQDFLSVETDFGTAEDFRRLVQTIHTAGMNIMIDFVPKYTAWDSKLVMEHPDWFHTNEEGAIVAPNNEWDDVADLNYDHHELRKYMIDALKFWVQEQNIDGFAFQKADLIPLEFWVRARKEVESIKPVVFLAQSNVADHLLEAFDASYTNESGIAGLAREGIPTELFTSIINEQHTYPQGYSRMRFTSIIQDFPQLDLEVAQFEKNHTVLAYTIPGIPVHVFDSKWLYSSSSSSDLTLKLAEQLITLRKTYPALATGELTERKLAENATSIAFERKSETERVMVLLNFSKDPQHVLLQVPDNFLGGFKDYLTATTLTPKSGALGFSVPPYYAKILIRISEVSKQ